MGALLLYAAAAVAIGGATFAYWYDARRRRTVTTDLPACSMLWLGGALGLAFCLWSVYLERPTASFEQHAEPLALAIAFDLSPSMLAIPDPAVEPGVLSRYRRGTETLLEMLRGIDERDAGTLVSIVGFTRRADVVMGWNRDIGQAREVIRHALSPDVFGSSGTSMEAATDALDDVFAMLPDRFAAVRRVAIIVSDGQDTMRKASLDYAVDAIARGGFDVIALQAGSFESDEGVPVFDGPGQFTGFERIGGELYTRPDAAAMHRLAGTGGDGGGLYLRAEAPDAARRMLDFAVGAGPGRRVLDSALLPAFGMFSAVFALLAWSIR